MSPFEAVEKFRQLRDCYKLRDNTGGRHVGRGGDGGVRLTLKEHVIYYLRVTIYCNHGGSSSTKAVVAQEFL